MFGCFKLNSTEMHQETFSILKNTYTLKKKTPTNGCFSKFRWQMKYLKDYIFDLNLE